MKNGILETVLKSPVNDQVKADLLLSYLDKQTRFQKPKIFELIIIEIVHFISYNKHILNHEKDMTFKLLKTICNQNEKTATSFLNMFDKIQGLINEIEN